MRFSVGTNCLRLMNSSKLGARLSRVCLSALPREALHSELQKDYQQRDPNH